LKLFRPNYAKKLEAKHRSFGSDWGNDPIRPLPRAEITLRPHHKAIGKDTQPVPKQADLRVPLAKFLDLVLALRNKNYTPQSTPQSFLQVMLLCRRSVSQHA
jgi:hypothetical protein